MIYDYAKDWKYTEPRGNELPIGTRIRIILEYSYGELATIEAYHQEHSDLTNDHSIWYHIIPDKGFTPPSGEWVIHPKWFEVIE